MATSDLYCWILFSFSLLIAGCGTDLDPYVIQYRQSLLLSEKPVGAVSIQQARESIAQKQYFTFSVKVGSKDIPQWWAKDKATMVVSEGLSGSHYNLANGHNPETCPFCRRKWKVENAAAFVEFRDAQGEIIPCDCRTLFGLKESDHVFVSGTATINKQGFLEIVADGIFIVGQQAG